MKKSFKRGVSLFLGMTCALGIGLSLQAKQVEAHAAVSTSVIINEVYGGGGNTGATYQNDFIELYNLSGSSVDLTGWTLQYASKTGAFNITCSSASSCYTTTLSGSISAHSYLLIKEASGGAIGSVLPTVDVSPTYMINMSNSGGKVALMKTATVFDGLLTNSNLVDFVGYGSTSNTPNLFEGASYATGMTNSTSPQRKIFADTDNNSTDFGSTTPTPKSSSVSAAAPAFSTLLITSTEGKAYCSALDWGTIDDSYVAMTAAEKTEFNTSTSDLAIVAARNRYNYLRAYNTSLNDFAGLGSSPAINVGTLTDDSSLVMIIIIAALGLTAVMAYSLGKKKEEQA